MKFEYKFGIKELMLLIVYTIVTLVGTWIFCFFGDDIADKVREALAKRKERKNKNKIREDYWKELDLE